MFSFAATKWCSDKCKNEQMHTIDCLNDQFFNSPIFRRHKPNNNSVKKGKKNVRPA